MDSILNCVEPVVIKEINRQLIKPITVEEIKEAIFQMGARKVPGPNGCKTCVLEK